MKKWSKRIFYLVIFALFGLILLDGGLALVSQAKWFRTRVETAVEQALGRDIQLGRIGANLSGIFIEDFQIAPKEGFEKGVFARMGRLRIRVSLWHLLHGHIKVRALLLSDVHVNLIVYADGTTNWQDWVSSSVPTQQTEETSTTFTPHITAERVRLDNLSVSFEDQPSQRTLSAKEINLEVTNFGLEREFSLSLWASFHHQESSFERTIPLLLRAKINLCRLDWERAYATIKLFKAFYQKSSVMLEGSISNFINPQADLKLTVNKLSSDLFEGVAALPTFALAKATGVFNVSLDTQKQALSVRKVTLQAPGFNMQAQGELTYTNQVRYQFTTQFTAVLGEMGRWFTALADPYRLVGTVQTQATLTQDKLTAQIDLENVGGFVAQAGQLSNITGRLAGWEGMDFNTGHLETTLNGKFEASPLSLSFTADQTPQKIVSSLQASAKELIWHAAADASASGQSSVEASKTTGKSAWPLPPVDLKADLDVGKLDVPYFYGTEISFNADVQNLTPDLKQTQGMLRLRTQNGKIQDIYKLTNTNPITKVLFMSLNLTGKVFNSLNVLGVLKGIGGGISSIITSDSKEEEPLQTKTQTVLGPDGEPLEVPVVQTEQKIEGEMVYDKFDTQVNFEQGTATVKEGTFVSPTMSLRLDGTTNFNTGLVNFTVHAAPGRHEVDGMLPLTIKIGGTVEEPTGSMQLLGSVASLVKQTVANNVVSRNVTKGVKGLFGLFKKKGEPTQDSTDIQE